MPRLCRCVRPDACVAISLQFQIDRKMILLRRILLLQAPHLALGSEEVLHMVAQLMRKHISLREVRGASAKSLQVIPEIEVHIDLSIARAIERSCRRFCRTAGIVIRVCGSAKEHEPGMLIGRPALLLKDLGPRRLHIVQREGDQMSVTVFRIALFRSLGLLLFYLLCRSSTAEERAQEIASCDKADDQQDDETDNSNSAATDAEPTAATA